MSTKIDVTPESEHELVICKILDIPVEQAFRAYTDPKLLAQWFCPKPWFISDVDIDPRAGGKSNFTINGPAGEKMPCQGIYLEVIPNKKIVTTDAILSGWKPSAQAFMVATVTFEDVGGKTKYTAKAQHWTKEACEQHKQMGFEDGWGVCADQLEALMKSL